MSMFKVTPGPLTTIWPLEAFGYYHKLNAPVKKLLLLENGKEYTVLSSKGEDNIDKLHLRHLFNLTRRIGK